MRLFEVTDRFVDDLIAILDNLKGHADSKRSPQTLTYPALSQYLKNMGYGTIQYQQFARLYDENPELKGYVANFDENNIVLGTKTEPENDDQPMNVPDGPSVDQMAHNVVSKEF